MKSFKKILEDIQPGYAPEEISFGGYTTKNLHHSADAAKAFQSTIEKVKRGEITDSTSVLHALKATDTYMKLNDMHLEQGKAPDEKELQEWRDAHTEARYHLNKIGEFMHHEDYWHMHEHELQDIEANYTPETAGAEMADSYQPQAELVEALTDKTIKSGDKIKVARVIADMLGVENAETMAPEAAINAGLRKIKNKRMTPELTGVITKMLGLAREVGVKIDPSLVPKSISEAVVNKKSTYNIAGDILRYKDFQKLKGVGQQNEADNSVVIDKGEIGAALHADQSADTVRKMKVKYKTEDMASADYKVNPETGRKYRAHKINFANSRSKGKLDHEDIKEEVEDFDFSEDDLEKMAGSVNTEDDIMHTYDDGELILVDSETGEEINEEAIINTEILSEVMSRIERMKAKIRFARTEPKRERRMQIALKRRSDTKTLNKRARRVAIDLMKQRIMRKPAAQLTVSEKERVERILSKRKAAIDRLAMKLAPRVRKIETDRLSHSKATQS